MRVIPPTLRRHGGRALLVALGLWGCSQEFERTADLGDGEIRLTPRRQDGKLASRAVAAISGGARVAATRQDATALVESGQDTLVLPGLFAGLWLVRVSEDSDAGGEADGVTDRGTWLVKRLELVPIPRGLSDGCGGEPPRPVVNTEVLGDVALEEAAALDVRIQVDDGSGPRALDAGERARVVVWRDLELDGISYATAVEASGSVLDGAARVRGVIPGTVHVAVLVFGVDEPAGSPRLYGVADVELAPGGASAVELVASIPGREGDAPRAVQAPVELQWDVAVTGSVDIDQAGPVDIAPTGALELRDVEPGATATLSLPIGVWTLGISTPTDGLAGGQLVGVVVAPADPEAAAQGAADGARLGPVELATLSDPCAPLTPDAPRDCDHDDVPDDADADRDGDGQLDRDEGGDEGGDGGCVAPGRGTDFDGDGLCEPVEDAVD